MISLQAEASALTVVDGIEETMLVTGMANVATVQVTFSDDWDNLHKTIVFSNGDRTITHIMEADDEEVPIPSEVLTVPGRMVYVGVQGSDGDRVILPTIKCRLARVLISMDPNGDPAAIPTKPQWEQIREDMEELSESAASSAAAAGRSAGQAEDSATAANNAKSLAQNAMTGARDYERKAEGYAVGTQNDVPVEEGSPYYHNNAGFYAGQAADSATAAAASAAAFTTDPNLATAGKAADAKAAGAVIKAATGNGVVALTAGQYYGIPVNDSAVDDQNPSSNENYSSVFMSCNSGDVFVATLYGGTGTARAYAWLKSDKTVISKANANTNLANSVLTAPANTAYVVFNTKNANSDASYTDYYVLTGRPVVEFAEGADKLRAALYTKFSSGDDLNDYKTRGNYLALNTTVAGSLLHSPTSSPGMLIVRELTTTNTLLQTYIPYIDGSLTYQQFTRYWRNGSWGKWSSEETALVPDGTNDMKTYINTMLSTRGKVVLRKGTYYVSGITMPDNTCLEGSGAGTVIRLMDSVTSGAAITMGAHCLVSNLTIIGADTDITPTSTEGTRHGILYAGTGSDSTIKMSTIKNVWLRNFTGGGIRLYNTGYTTGGCSIDAVRAEKCYCGIWIPKFSEYHMVSNCISRLNYYGIICNGGNNVFTSCNFDSNIIGLWIDNSSGTSNNNTHGSFNACSFNHNGSDPGTAIQITGGSGNDVISSGEVFSACQIWYGEVTLSNIYGVTFSACNFGATAPITIYHCNTVVFEACLFKSKSESPITVDNTEGHFVRFIDCYTRSGGLLVGGDYAVQTRNLEELIDDTAGSGDTTHVWSADKMVTELAKKAPIIVASTSEAAVASVSDGADGEPARSLVVGIEPVQDLHGYDNPWPAGGGANKLLPMTNDSYTATANGIKITYSKDTESFNITGTNEKTDASWLILNGSTYDLTTLEAGKTYYYAHNLPSTLYSQITYNKSGGGFGTLAYKAGTGSFAASSFTLPNDFVSVSRFQIGVYNTTGQVDASNIVFGIFDSSPTAWSPYSNVCPITGWTGANVYRSGADTSNPTTYPISWQSAGTVYGGTLDVTTGVLTVDRAYHTVSADDTAGLFQSGTNANRVGIRLPDSQLSGTADKRLDIICNKAVASTDILTASTQKLGDCCMYSGGSDTYSTAVFGVPLTATTSGDAKAYLVDEGYAFVYKLDTPITYQLTPQEVTTLLGENNIWADCGTIKSMQYPADTKLYIDQKITAAIAAALNA